MKLIRHVVLKLDESPLLFTGALVCASLPVNLMAITLRPCEITDLGKKEVPLSRLVPLGWLVLENHLSYFLGYTYSWLFQSCKAANYWALSHFKWQSIAERASFSEIIFSFIFLSIWPTRTSAYLLISC